MVSSLNSLLIKAPKYRSIFDEFPSFNLMQSAVIDFVLHSDSSVVISAPTGSGKTVVFELAIIWLMDKFKNVDPTNSSHKIVYMAPVKALCTERYSDWSKKLSPLNLKVVEITGDTNECDLDAIKNYDLIITTPEKWDSMTRKWTDHRAIVQVIKLFLIDEVHLLNEERRGATLEAVVSRMKTVQETRMKINAASEGHVRFVAVSAVINNIEDVSRWLGLEGYPAKFYKFDEAIRPVKIRKVVLGYNDNKSSYKFEMNLSYRLESVLQEFSEGNPTLIFCSTRKSTQQTATVLSKQIKFEFTEEQSERLNAVVGHLFDNNLRELVKNGMGYHHAGMVQSDRNRIEELFRSGYLPILIATSTLAMGVNLPAHLVIIKSTEHYVDGTYQEYSEAQILQMIGRAGRPQFGVTATAVIMTTQSKKPKYEKLVSGRDLVESCLHNYLVEHLNSEIVLRTVTDIEVAMKWLRSTFLYVRACKNPRHYGLPGSLREKEIEQKLLDLCMRELNGLRKYEMIEMSDSAYNVRPTENGKLMARYYIAFETMKIFMTINGNEQLPDLLDKICLCHEFEAIQLRWSEKSVLNSLNQNKDRPVIRYPKKGKVKTKDAKINYLIQASLGGIQIPDPSLVQESIRIMKILQRLLNGLVLFLWRHPHYRVLESALVLKKCVQAKMWENSRFVTRQLPGIGPSLAELLANANKTSFRAIIESNPRDLERIINRQPPMGNQLQEAALRKPQYELDISKDDASCFAKITLTVKNIEDLKYGNSLHRSCLLVADSNNVLLKKDKISDSSLVSSKGVYSFQVRMNTNIEEIIAVIISDSTVGVDIKSTYKIATKEFETGDLIYNTEVTEAKKKSSVTKAKPQSSAQAPTLPGSPKAKLTDYSFKVTKKPLLKRPQPPAPATSEVVPVDEVTRTQDFIPPAPKARYSLHSRKDMGVTKSSDHDLSDDEKSRWLNDLSDEENDSFIEKESNHSGVVAPDSCMDDRPLLKCRTLIFSPGGTEPFNCEQKSQASRRSLPDTELPHDSSSEVPTVQSCSLTEVEDYADPSKPGTSRMILRQGPTFKTPAEALTSTVFQVPDDQFLDDIDCLDIDLGLKELNYPRGPSKSIDSATVDGINLDDVKKCSTVGYGFSLDELLDDSPSSEESSILRKTAEEIYAEDIPTEDVSLCMTIPDCGVDQKETIALSNENSKDVSSSSAEEIPPPGTLPPSEKASCGPRLGNSAKDDVILVTSCGASKDSKPGTSGYEEPVNGVNQHMQATNFRDADFLHTSSGRNGTRNQTLADAYSSSPSQYEEWSSNYGGVTRNVQPSRVTAKDFIEPTTIIDYDCKPAFLNHSLRENLESDSSSLFYRRRSQGSLASERYCGSSAGQVSRDPREVNFLNREGYPGTKIVQLEPTVQHLFMPEEPPSNLPADYDARFRTLPIQAMLPAVEDRANQWPPRSLRSEYGDPYEDLYSKTMKKLAGPTSTKPSNSPGVLGLNQYSSLMRDEYKSTFPVKIDSRAPPRRAPLPTSRPKHDSKSAFTVVHDPSSARNSCGRFHPYGRETKRAPEFEFSEGHTRLPPKPVHLTRKERLNRAVQKYQDVNRDSNARPGGGSSCDRLSSLLWNFNSEGAQQHGDGFYGFQERSPVDERNTVHERKYLDSDLHFDAGELLSSDNLLQTFESQRALIHGSLQPTKHYPLDNPLEDPNLWNFDEEQENYNFGNDLWDEAPSNNNNFVTEALF